MRITLKNFKCHTDATFQFADHGLIALSGASGSGKSSLLSGICYGLYGKIPSKIKKPYTHGKTTSSVEIEYMGLEITRHARPKRLIVVHDSVEYEGEPAQNVINQTLGMNYEEFLATTYVVQRGNASVLSLPSAKQVEFIQTLANSSVERYKLDIKEKVKDVIMQLAKIKAEVEILEAQKTEKEELYPEVPAIPKEIASGIDPDKIRKHLQSLEATLASDQKTLVSARADLEKVRVIEKKREDVNAKINKLNNELESLQPKTGTLDLKGIQMRINELQREIVKYRGDIDYYDLYLTYKKDKHALQIALEEHFAGVEQRLAELGSNVIDEDAILAFEEEIVAAEAQKEAYDARKAIYDAQISDKESARQALSEKFKIIKSIPELKNISNVKTPSKIIAYLDTHLQLLRDELSDIKRQTKKRMKCPGCSKCVCLTDDGISLELVDDETSSKMTDVDEDLVDSKEASISIIERYRAEIQELSKTFNAKIEPLEDAPPNPLEMHKSLISMKMTKEEYERLSSGQLPPVITRMKESVEHQDSTYAEEDMTEEEVMEYLKKLQEEAYSKNYECDVLSESIKADAKNREDIASKKKQLRVVEQTLPPPPKITSKTLEEQISQKTKSLSDVNIEIQAKRKILDSVADYEHYQNTVLEITNISNSISQRWEMEDELGKKLEGLYGLEEAEKEAEILALEETVSSINEHAKIHLDHMFSDPIMVRLQCVKDKGKNGIKLQLNTVIDYKGDTYDDIEELSGGERQRCDMAFLLGVNDMLGSGMLILDECLNELDASINTEVLSLIRDMCGSTKMILVVSHEAVRGVFDHDIQVSH